MKKITIAAIVIVAMPALAAAQSRASAGGQANVNANASVRSSAGSPDAGPSDGGAMSADAQARIAADLAVARERRLPDEPIRRRVAEGQAKGATEAQIVAASGRTLVNLQASHDALVRAGRSKPSDAEVARGAELIATGRSGAQVETAARRGTLGGVASGSVAGAVPAGVSAGIGGAVSAAARGMSAGAGGSVAGGVSGTVGGLLGRP